MMDEKSADFRATMLGRWGRWAATRWRTALLLGVGITLLLGSGFLFLRMEMTFFSVMPDNSTQVQDLKRILAEFPFSSAVMVVVDGRGISDAGEAERTVKATVDAVEEALQGEEFSEYVIRATGRIDTEFFESHALALSEPAEIARFKDMYTDLDVTPIFRNLNNDLEREYSGNEQALADDEDMAVSQFRGLEQLFTLLEEAANGDPAGPEEVSSVLDRFLYGQEYLLSRDNRMAICIVEPAFTMEDLPVLVPGVNAMEKRVKEIASGYGVEAGLTGLTVVARDEMVTSEQGIVLSMAAAVVLILLLQIFTFRMFVVPLISGVPLLTGILWTMGVTGFIIHRLNIMTAMYMVALVGLGIDYAIHIMTTFVQERDEGAGFLDAMEAAFAKSGVGIITGALTTAVAFFMLATAESSLMRELGLVAGLGIICELAAMLLLIPGLLGLREHRLHKRHREKAGQEGFGVYAEAALFRHVHIRADLAGGVGKLVTKAPLIITLLSIGICIALSTRIGRVTIETNLMKMEAKGLESIELQDTLVQEFDMAPDGLSILAGDIEEVEALHDSLEDLGSVRRVESIEPYVVDEEQDRKVRPDILEIRENVATVTPSPEVDAEALLEELYRLQDNLLELSDLAFLGGMERIAGTLNRVTGWDSAGDKTRETDLDRLIRSLEESPDAAQGLADFQEVFVQVLREKVQHMATPGPVTVSQVPGSIRDSYVSRDGQEFLLTAIPTRNPWEEEFRNTFTAQVASVTPKATGMILAADQMTHMAKSDGIRASIAAVAAVFLILLLDFRNIKMAVLTMMPLLCSFVTLFGFMGLTGIKFDFINIIAVPLLIGIGIDDAVHISHRYLLEGGGRMERVIARTGSAVLLTTLTTMIGFASFIPSIMRAMRSTGIVLTIAMAVAFLFSVLLHPSLLILVAERMKLDFSPWGSNRKAGEGGDR